MEMLHPEVMTTEFSFYSEPAKELHWESFSLPASLAQWL